MMLTDTHTHLYLPHFESDIENVVARAREKGVKYMFMPNIDTRSISGMMDLTAKFPGNCFPMMGLHPNSVNKDFDKDLSVVSSWLKKEKFAAIGETGIDLYRSKDSVHWQSQALSIQLKWAKDLDLPLVLHSRNSFEEVYEIVSKHADKNLRGVFHSFSGNADQAKRAVEAGFMLGVNGVITFKNTKLVKVLENVDLSNIILETDSPFLTPEPYRGRRNESSYIFYIAEKVAEIYSLSVEEVAEITTKNAFELFNSIN